LQFADCSPKKLAELQFALQSKENCGFVIFGLTYLRNLRIFYCELSQEFADLKNHLHAHLCIYATVVNHTGGKFDTGGILPPVSTTPAVHLPVSTAPVMHLEL
jgi:hypothetical protein